MAPAISVIHERLIQRQTRLAEASDHVLHGGQRADTCVDIGIATEPCSVCELPLVRAWVRTSVIDGGRSWQDNAYQAENVRCGPPRRRALEVDQAYRALWVARSSEFES